MTCGLRISDSPTSDNLTPQETTKHDVLGMGAGGAGLSCPGSSEVAERRLISEEPQWSASWHVHTAMLPDG
jgi:hypothetical protein